MTDSFSELAVRIFTQVILDYKNVNRNVNSDINNPYPLGSIEAYLYLKNWIDNIQWSLEDIIRDPNIEPSRALDIKRWIDRSNQERTDTVECIDNYFRDLYKDVIVTPSAKINTESPAWAIDRLSILMLKITYMGEACTNEKNSQETKDKCKAKLSILLQQKEDLCTAIDELILDISKGVKYMKVYRQMKMYNDPELNPILKGKNL